MFTGWVWECEFGLYFCVSLSEISLFVLLLRHPNRGHQEALVPWAAGRILTEGSSRAPAGTIDPWPVLWWERLWPTSISTNHKAHDLDFSPVGEVLPDSVAARLEETETCIRYYVLYIMSIWLQRNLLPYGFRSVAACPGCRLHPCCHCHGRDVSVCTKLLWDSASSAVVRKKPLCCQCSVQNFFIYLSLF